jgi:hypothetical protein
MSFSAALLFLIAWTSTEDLSPKIDHAGHWHVNDRGTEAGPLRPQFMRPQLSHHSKIYALRSEIVGAWYGW